MRLVIIVLMSLLVLQPVCFGYVLGNDEVGGTAFQKNPITAYRFCDIGWEAGKDISNVGLGEIYLKAGIFNIKKPSETSNRASLYAKIGDRFTFFNNYSLAYGIGFNLATPVIEFDIYGGLESRFAGNSFGNLANTSSDYRAEFTYHLMEERQ